MVSHSSRPPCAPPHPSAPARHSTLHAPDTKVRCHTLPPISSAQLMVMRTHPLWPRTPSFTARVIVSPLSAHHRAPVIRLGAPVPCHPARCGACVDDDCACFACASPPGHRHLSGFLSLGRWVVRTFSCPLPHSHTSFPRWRPHPHALSSPTTSCAPARSLRACCCCARVVCTISLPLSSHTSIPWPAPALRLCGFTSSSHHRMVCPWVGIRGLSLAALLGSARPCAPSPLSGVCVRAFDFLTHLLAPRAPPRRHSTRSIRHQGAPLDALNPTLNSARYQGETRPSRRHRARGLC